MITQDILNSISLNSRDQNGNNILQQAVLEKNIDIVALILSKIENSPNRFDIVNAQNNEGDTAFFLAVKKNYLMIAQMLDYAGADKEIKNNDGQFVIDESKDQLSTEDDGDDPYELLDSEIVDFEFPVVKCSNNSPEEEMNDLTDIVFTLGTLNIPKNNNEKLVNAEDSEIMMKTSDPYLNRLTDQYILLQKMKQSQKGGARNKILYGSRNI
ncbi:hypothetical protein CPAV1605_717 [seawater metagenome]|uniref:Uncharacterized protein n=1 Tax=seawater metagenome TaxID=1561972 RepID=A0A5E8CLU6_9ZZZZ